MEYNFREVEKKWQAEWRRNKTFRADNHSSKPKYYVLDMFPYPSGAGLHVGHPLGYIASDIYTRYKRLKGFNVLHPMGYDAFGLPAEQYAIQTGQHPAVTTEENIKRYREQLDNIGFSFDWDREVRTSDPAYYKWTQWIFLKLFNAWYNTKSNKAEGIDALIAEFEKNGNAAVAAATEQTEIFSAAQWKAFSEKEKQKILLNYRLAYLGEAMVNWCPALGTVLANDEVKDGVSERGGYPVERKLMKQWSLRITAYAQRLLDDLETIDWTESIKDQQRNWIGRSEGSSLKFRLIPNPSPKEKGEEPFGYETSDKLVWPYLKEFAKENRKNQTEAEKIIWENVRDNKLGFKIRRQHAIASFIGDFVCLEKKLVIEIDGDIHENQKEYDEERTFYLNLNGFHVIRFSNQEVLDDLQQVLEKIKTELQAPSPLLRRGAGGEAFIEVFTTRPDTIFGATFVTLAPEHELTEQLVTADRREEVMKYVLEAKNRSERERMAEVKRITGVFTGAYVEHPFTGQPVPIWIGDYVLAGYGTGAVMAVPAHDSRDHAFAKHFGLEIKQVITAPEGIDIQKESFDAKEGKCINSDFLNGLEVKDAIRKIISEIEKRGLGQGKVNFRLRDAVFGRQRYWGEPIPIYYKDGIPYPVEEKDLPVLLPEVDKYLPTEDGEPPLARAKDWKYKNRYEFETTTMPGWAGSSWYYLRYEDAKNEKEFVSKDAVNYWLNIDLYIGGSEHATGHLLYFRFWTKFLYDLGYLSFQEPAKKLINQGMIQGMSQMVYRHKEKKEFISYDLLGKKQDEYTAIYADVSLVDNSGNLNTEEFTRWRPDYEGYTFVKNESGKFLCGVVVEKMSKSKYNVVNPDDVINQHGADCLRLYEMFLGPLDLPKPWNTTSISGTSNFIRKLWRLYHSKGKEDFFVSDDAPTKEELKTLHKTIRKAQEDIERFSFNTSVSTFMICVNELTDLKCNKRAILEPLAIVISPYAPHIAEELWSLLGHTESITFATFPEFKEEYVTEDSFSYPVSLNGKTKFNLSLSLALGKEEIEKEVMNAEEVKKMLAGQSPKKIIIVHGRIVNIVI